jgi:hypothetical protein
MIHYTYDGCGWLECFAGDSDAEHGSAVCTVEPGDTWDDLAARVTAHQAEHGCAFAGLPGWDDLSDRDKGAALLFLAKVENEGREYAQSDYPCSYFDHPALTGLAPERACGHAASLGDTTSMRDQLGADEHDRLYDLALDADRARHAAGHAAGTDAP